MRQRLLMKKRLLAAAASLAVILSLVNPGFGQNWDHAVSLFNQKQYRPAIREFHGVLRANPDYWQAWYYIGSCHFQLKEYEDTIDAFDRYIKGASGHPKDQATGYYFVGFSYYELKQYDKAAPALAQYISISEKQGQKVETTALAALGRSYIFSNKYSEAIPVLTKAAAEMRTNSDNYYYLAFAQHSLNHDDLAITDLNQALSINPKDQDSLSLLTSIYLGRAAKDPSAAKQAVASAEKLFAAKGDDASAGILGQAYLFDKQYSKAAPLLDRFAKVNQTSAPAWYNLGLALSRSSQWEPASAALEQAAKLAPTNRAALLELGYVYESNKKYEKALSSYQKAYELSGNKDESARTSIDRVKQRMAAPTTQPPGQSSVR